MAGGYNNNDFKYVVSMLPEDAVILPLGKRSGEYFKRSKWECVAEAVPVADLTVGSCYTISTETPRSTEHPSSAKAEIRLSLTASFPSTWPAFSTAL